jgi:prevent-host-death family protein
MVNVKETRRHISRLLDAVIAGEEIIIVRRGKPVARLVQISGEETQPLRFPDRSDLRRKLPPMSKSSASLIREMRDERG